MTLHRGGCHCGAVSFEFECDRDVVVRPCNCSICEMDDFQHLILPAKDFRLLKGEAALSTYTFNTGIAKHRFCSACGIKSFYIPRSNPDGVSVNFRCVDRSTFGEISFANFDGKNWEANAATLSHLSDSSS